MSDLTNEELNSIERWGYEQSRQAAAEIRRHRADLTADEERVRSVVRDVVTEVAIDWSPKLSAVTLPMLADAIATRAAEQLASAAVRLSANDRQVLNELSGHMKLTATEQSLLDRLLATVRP